MRKLASYARNPFDAKSISFHRLSSYTTDHAESLQADNPGGVHDVRIAATLAAFSVVELRFNQDLANLGTRKAYKSAKDLFRQGLGADTERVEIALKAAFGANGLQVQQAFPQGRSVFSKCPDDMVDNHLSIMNGVVAANAASLTPAIVTFSAGLVSGWATLYAQSEEASAEKTFSEAERRAARLALQTELYLNLAHLMACYPRQPEKLAQYMKQHLLQDLSEVDDDEDEEEEPEPEPPVEE